MAALPPRQRDLPVAYSVRLDVLDECAQAVVNAAQFKRVDFCELTPEWERQEEFNPMLNPV
jgi:hypothetical protein